MDKRFSRYATYLADIVGTPRAFFVAILLLALWLCVGPFVGFSDTWQLVINSVMNTLEFLILFLIQNTQNRDSVATQIKLDELIRIHKNAHDALMDIEGLTEDQLNRIRKQYTDLARKARKELGNSKLPKPE